MKTFSEWVTTIVRTKLDSEKLQRFAVGNTRQDLSQPILETLLESGYTNVMWDSGQSTHGVCVELNNQQWLLQDFIANLSHSAPIFEKTHPGDSNCTVVVSGDGVPTVRVDSYGNVEEI